MYKYDVKSMRTDYESGKFSIKAISDKYGVCVGTTYYLLRDAGCKFSKRMKKERTEEEKEILSDKLSNALKGIKKSEEFVRKMSESRLCKYDGLNGYGHIKNHNSGYDIVYVPNHPHATKDGYVMFHTVIMERAIGRYLNDDEVVHHINHDRRDNRIENLELMKKKDHMSMHMKERHLKRRNDLSIRCSPSAI